MQIVKNSKQFTVVLADKDLETFKRIAGLCQDYNFINLNSNFAVKFVMDYEKIDLIIISKNMEDLEDIIKKAKKKKIRVYQIGKDIKEPIDIGEVQKVLAKEYKNKADHLNQRKINISDLLAKFGRNPQVAAVGKKVKPKRDKKAISIQKTINRGQKIRAIKQKIIVFTKAKGGVGSTVLSIYLGYFLKNLKTLFIDLNFSQGGGDASFYLNIPKFPNLINFTSGYNGKSIQDSIINFKGGFDILQAPPTMELSKMIELQDIYNLVDIIKKKYDIIIFDLPNAMNDLNMGVIDLADILVMVSDSSNGSIGRLSEINKQLEYNDLYKILIFNKQKPKRKIDFKEYRGLFSVSDVLSIDNIDALTDRSDFSAFDFSSVKKFEKFSNKILDLLTSIQVVKQ